MMKPIAPASALLAAALLLQPAFAQEAAPPHKTAKADNPFLSADHGTADWFSLGPKHDSLIAGPYDKDEVTSDLRANESITVFARRHHPDIPEDFRTGVTPGEAWNSDAAHSYVPSLGDGCDKHSVCVSPDQKGLIPSLFGSD